MVAVGGRRRLLVVGLARRSGGSLSGRRRLGGPGLPGGTLRRLRCRSGLGLVVAGPVVAALVTGLVIVVRVVVELVVGRALGTFSCRSTTSAST
jgi:hypothetical protein